MLSSLREEESQAIKWQQALKICILRFPDVYKEISYYKLIAMVMIPNLFSLTIIMAQIGSFG